MSTSAFERALTAISNHVKYIDETANAITAKGVQSSGKLKNFPSEIARIQGGGGGVSVGRHIEKLVKALEDRGWIVEDEIDGILPNVPSFNAQTLIDGGKAALIDGVLLVGYADDTDEWGQLRIYASRFNQAYAVLYFNDSENPNAWPPTTITTERAPVSKGLYTKTNPLRIPLSAEDAEMLKNPRYSFSWGYIYFPYMNLEGREDLASINLYEFSDGTVSTPAELPVPQPL